VTNEGQAVSGTLLLGLGNDILSDDAIGLMIAAELRQMSGAGFSVVATAEMGLSLLDLIVGFRNVVIVDAIQTQRAPPGFLHQFGAGQLGVLPAISPHFLGIGEMLALGRQLGLAMPAQVTILAVEVEDPFTVSTSLTPALQEAFPHIVESVRAVVCSLASG
jgi:hydrogenase maturation protease